MKGPSSYFTSLKLFPVAVAPPSRGAQSFRKGLLLELFGMSSVSFISENRSVGLNQFHLEWCPKYRKKILVGEISAVVEASLLHTADQNRITIFSFHVGDDHVHLFVSLPFDLSISQAFRLLKGNSAREVFRRFPELRQQFRKGHFWSPGKFCRSVSNVKAETIKRYIQNHQFKELNASIKEAKVEARQLRLLSFC